MRPLGECFCDLELGGMAHKNQRRFARISRLLGFGAIAVALLALARPPAALGGGFFLYELGTPDVGLASAGYAARAQDASTVFTNPAGMTMLNHSQLLVGIQPIYTHLNFATLWSITSTGSGCGP